VGKGLGEERMIAEKMQGGKGVVGRGKEGLLEGDIREHDREG